MASFITIMHKQDELMRVVDQTLPKFKKLAILKRTELTIKRRLHDLQQILSQLRDNHAELKSLATSEQKKLEYFTENQFEDCMNVYDETVNFLEDMLVSETSKSSTNTAKAASVTETVQFSALPLPQFKLPTFSGDINMWEDFRDRFTATVIKDARLSESNKMKLLCNALEGSARRAIAHLRVTDTNFIIAWDVVCLKYQNLRENIAARFATFRAISGVSAHCIKNLQTLQEVVKSTPRSIQGLGRRSDGWSDLYVDCVLQKLDARMMMADRLPTDKDPITIEQIEEFLEHRIRVLQSGGQTSSPQSNARKSEKFGNKSPSKVTLNTVANVIKCVMCSASHKLNRCGKFRAL